jgi:hypothetical protein
MTENIKGSSGSKIIRALESQDGIKKGSAEIPRMVQKSDTNSVDVKKGAEIPSMQPSSNTPSESGGQGTGNNSGGSSGSSGNSNNSGTNSNKE